jgi:hypothetical protein
VRLVEQERDTAVLCPGDLTDAREGDPETVLQYGVRGRCCTGPNRDRQAVGKLHLDLADRVHSGGDPVLELCLDAQRFDRLAQVVGDGRREIGLLAQSRAPVTTDDDPLIPFGDPLVLLEQHGLPDAAQSCQEHALLSSLRLDPAKENTRLLKDSIAPHQLRRRSARPRRERILDRIHAPECSKF